MLLASRATWGDALARLSADTWQAFAEVSNGGKAVVYLVARCFVFSFEGSFAAPICQHTITIGFRDGNPFLWRNSYQYHTTDSVRTETITALT